jgi:peptidoglycan/xylan/chitin deacetylase (PgdA/CDA1 family)
LLDLLRDRNVQCTFFIQSSWANAYRHLAERIKTEGHLIGSHSHWHCVFTSMTDKGIANDLARSRSILDATAPTDHWFRLPGGQGHDDPRILAAVSRAGYRHIGWTCGGNDWEPGRTADEVAMPIIEHAKVATEPVVVPDLHSWPDPTTDAVAMVNRPGIGDCSSP